MKLPLTISVLAGLLLGCTSAPRASEGFLSEYGRLEEAPAGLRFLDLEVLANYRRFLIEPVEVYLYDRERLEDDEVAGLRRLATYFDARVREAVGSGYELASEPAPGVARIRVALSDIRSDDAVLGGLPHASRLGGTSMEAEILDSVTGRQFGAVVEGQTFAAIALADAEDWTRAEAALDEYARRFRSRLDQAHGR